MSNDVFDVAIVLVVWMIEMETKTQRKKNAKARWKYLKDIYCEIDKLKERLGIMEDFLGNGRSEIDNVKEKIKILEEKMHNLENELEKVLNPTVMQGL